MYCYCSTLVDRSDVKYISEDTDAPPSMYVDDFLLYEMEKYYDIRIIPWFFKALGKSRKILNRKGQNIVKFA